jgi:hypothetical protein
MQEEQILCACSAYEQKYYLNPRYASLPSAIQDELQIMAVTMTGSFLYLGRVSVTKDIMAS